MVEFNIVTLSTDADRVAAWLRERGAEEVA